MNLARKVPKLKELWITLIAKMLLLFNSQTHLKKMMTEVSNNHSLTYVSNSTQKPNKLSKMPINENISQEVTMEVSTLEISSHLFSKHMLMVLMESGKMELQILIIIH